MRPVDRAPHAWRRSIKDRARNAAQHSGHQAGELQRQFVYSRFLARVFQDETWILKGGVAVLARVVDARHSKDIDLLARLNNIDEAVASIRTACQRDAGDPFTFQVTGQAAAGDPDGQPGVDGMRINVEALLGPAVFETFTVDLVVGAVMTAEPDRVAPTMPFTIDGIETPTYCVYPAVDHVADKLCATETRYGINRDRRSSRVRDLVDLVVFARTLRFDAAALWNAIEAERSRRGLPDCPSLDVPPEWSARYSKEAASTPKCDGLSFAAAAGLDGME